MVRYIIYDMDYVVSELNEKTIRDLYCDFGLRQKEIASIFGITEDAVFKRIKSYGIPTNPRGTIRKDVTIIFTGMRKDLKKELTDDLLKTLCEKGMTDADIGALYGMTGEGVAYRRNKIGIKPCDKNTSLKIAKKRFAEKDTPELAVDYYQLTQKEFSAKYGMSKTLWYPLIKQRGIPTKTLHRIIQYPPLTQEQKNLIIGSLLGDGSVSGGDYYYESHSLKQEQYLRKKFNILKPFSTRIKPCDNGEGLRFSTVHHPVFRDFYRHFYREGIDGKFIPVDFIKANWHDDILAYWFLDDGTFNDEDNTFSIANKCPDVEQFKDMVAFLELRYHWGFHYRIGDMYWITWSIEHYREFTDILLRVATPDLYYKIPEKFLTQKMIEAVPIKTVDDIRPKFYRISDDTEKKCMETMLFNSIKKRGFPYVKFTYERLRYLVQHFKSNSKYQKKSDVLYATTSGMSLCEHFFPNIYECRRKGHESPLSAWNHDEFLLSLAVNRLKYADRLTDSSLRTGIKLLGHAVSNFKPTVARYVYKKYVPVGGRVYDFSCGFGSRMLAAMSLDLEYVGCEPNLKTFENLQKFGTFLSKHTAGKYFITEKGSEEFIPEGLFDLAFSSPPFFDHEIYSDDPGQSIIKFPDYDQWLDRFWCKTIENCVSVLKPGGYFGECITVNQHMPLIEKTKEICRTLGLELIEETRVPFSNIFKRSENYDLLIIFRIN